MKKIAPLILIIFALIGYIIFSWWGNQYDLEEAKQALETWTNSSETINAWAEVIQEEIDNNIIIDELSAIISEWPNYILERVTNEQYITISESVLKNATYDGKTEIAIDGIADLNVESIQVDFVNTSSDFPNDFYTLKNFTAWEAPFTYRASPAFQVLDTGENTYIFTAKTATGESKTKLIITTDITDSADTNEEETAISGSINDIQFPKGSFGEVIISNETTAFYTDLKWLEIQTAGWLSSTICEAPFTPEAQEWEEVEAPQHSITKFLLWKYSTWVYWNTCRATVSGKWISFYVLRLVWEENFKYEKHYLDYENGLHWIQELESGTGVTKENIWEKNTEFKSVDYEITTISDELFKEIITENR